MNLDVKAQQSKFMNIFDVKESHDPAPWETWQSQGDKVRNQYGSPSSWQVDCRVNPSTSSHISQRPSQVQKTQHLRGWAEIPSSDKLKSYSPCRIAVVWANTTWPSGKFSIGQDTCTKSHQFSYRQFEWKTSAIFLFFIPCLVTVVHQNIHAALTSITSAGKPIKKE